MAKQQKDPDLILIDEDDIEREWVNHPSNVAKYTRLLAEARHHYDEAKAHVELLAARLGLKIRKRPESFGLPEDPREGAVTSAIKSHPKYVQAVAELNRTRYELEMTKGALKTLDNKKRSMEYIMEIRYQEGNSEPRMRGDVREASTERRKRLVRAAVSRPKIR